MDDRMESRLDRIIQLSKSILDQLQSEKRLSDILPQARSLTEVSGDTIQTAWLDNEIYGMTRVPFASKPRRTFEEQEGLKIFMEWEKTKDVEKAFAHRKPDDDIPPDDMILTHSIGELEHLSITEHPAYRKRIYYPHLADEDRKSIRSMLETERVLKAVRAAVHKYVSRVWLNAVQEKENQSLLGPNYRIVINNLDALETGVGQELMAALQNLSSENPANWSASALVCRNVIIKLGDSLWKVPCTKYFSELASKELDLMGEREKNRLYAYIDCQHRRAEGQENKDTLKQLHGMVWRIWDIGSKAKRSIRHEDAQTAVVDTFAFVNNLDEITELKPLEEV